MPLLLTPVRGGAEANRALAREVINLIDGLVITGGGDIHPRHYVPPITIEALTGGGSGHFTCASSTRCMSTGEEVPFCGHFIREGAMDAAVDAAAGKTPQASEAERATILDGRMTNNDPAAVRVPCLDGLDHVSEDRDVFELELAKLAHERNLPCLGICRGMQIMNVALGGSLYRDLCNCGVTKIKHMQEPPYNEPTDRATIEEATLLGRALQTKDDWQGYIDCRDWLPNETAINSMHHQGVDHLAAPLTVNAHAHDHTIEGIEDPTKNFFLGVQWHPEYLEHHKGIFETLVAATH
jgi:putative glutamine amidotransferase